MTGLEATIYIIAAHSAISLVCLAIALIRRAKAMCIISLIMLASPPVGVPCFLGAWIAKLFMRRGQSMQVEDISFSKEKRNRAERPDVEMESQAVPLEEVLLVSSDAIKRSHLLMQLKQSSIENFDMIRKALDSDDPETSHYAASALTSAKAKFENTIREMDRKYIANSRDGNLIRAYADYVLGYLKSGILDQLEEKKYSYVYLNILTTVDNPQDVLTEYDYLNVVDRAIFLEDYKTAQEWAERGFEMEATESTFLNLLKVYYYTNQSDQFFETMNKLKRSDVTLSEDGLAIVRFFARARPALGREVS